MAWQDRAYNNEQERGGPRLIFPMPTLLTFWLILSCVLVFVAQFMTSPGRVGASQVVQWGELTFRGGKAFYEPWRWITYQYVHESGAHIFWNLVSMYFLVPMLERMWGWQRTLLMYTVGGMAAAVAYGFISLIWPTAGLVGASGSILAVLGALAAVAPDAPILAMMVIPITMRLLAILYTIFFIFMILGDRSFGDVAHLGGLAFGWIGCLYGGGLARRTTRSYRANKARRERQFEQAEQDAIDRILQKVSEHGMHSLSGGEKRTLKRATERQRRRDAELSRGRRF